MELFLCFFFLFFSGLLGDVYGLSKENSIIPTKLFVFGDSYADTGNLEIESVKSWHVPYGVTYPGRPSGRYSDGRVLTDFIASFIGISSPAPYRLIARGEEVLYISGMNFAYGGSGVFEIVRSNRSLLPNISTQIDYFQNLMNRSVYNKQDLQSSLVLVSNVGNDYAFFLDNGGTLQGLQSFIPRVVNQVVADLKRLRGLGATKIVLTSLQPVGCLPQRTISNSYQQCVADQNLLASFHNQLLSQAVAAFNNETVTSQIVTLNLYNAFTTVLNNQTAYSQNMRFESPLRPCCMGSSSGFTCGDSDSNGTRQYTVCSDPTTSFFWDEVHPTQAGWNAVFPILKSTLQQFLQSYQMKATSR